MCDCTPVLSPVNSTTNAIVDRLHNRAVYRLDFYSQMLHTFGSDELAPEAIEAFSYARLKYDYLSPSELAELAEALGEDDDVCRHGLDSWTCPAGCFEEG